ncbi:MAG TPA: putative baseplate assembly protein, partial [Mycobacteriales bacterium]|nr:putative baseplate assembly protein [Mycobacteriales bacterium]
TRDDFGPSDRSRPVAELISGESVTLPALRLTELASGEEWTARPDLLSSDAAATDVVVEVEDDARAAIRFGDDVHGRRPDAGDALSAHYRVGQGVAGNIGVDAIRQVATTIGGIESATNPLAGWGGREPQSLEEVRQQAPIAFRSQERAVTAEDYATVAQRHPGVQRAVATIEWTGSWRTVFVTVDRTGGLTVDPAFADRLRGFLERFRLAGHDVEIEAPVFVPLEIELFVCVAPDQFRSDIRAALLDVFSSGIRANGRPGLFHPDEFTFGQPVLLSRLYAAAQAVPGVVSVEVTMFRRFGQPASSALDTGELRLGRTEIARLDNDPNFPDRGVLRISLGGGR